MATIRSADTVQVAGLREFRSELRKLDEPGLVDGLKDANYEVAHLVISRAKLRARAMGGMESKAAETMTAGRAQARATVSFGGAKAPFAAGAEFGADRNKLRLVRGREARTKQYEMRLVDSVAYGKQVLRRVRVEDDVRRLADRRIRGWNQFRPWRGNKEGAGYWFFPAVRQATPEIVDLYGDRVVKLAQKAFPD